MKYRSFGREKMLLSAKKICIVSCCILVGVKAVVAQRGEAVHDYIGIYQKYLRGLKDVQCPMYPTCSQYGKMVFADHSFPVAMMMTADRLLRCGGDIEQYAVVGMGRHEGRLLDYPSGRAIPAQLTATPTQGVAAETILPTDSVTKSIQFTNLLINRRSYASALLEIERILYTDTSLRHEPSLYLNKMRCYEGIGQYSEGVVFYEQMPTKVKSDYRVRCYAAHLYDMIGDVGKSIETYREASTQADSNDAHVYGELAVLYTKELLYEEARNALALKCSIDNDTSGMNVSIDIVKRLEEAKFKNPTTAMLLGILPGAGYLYAGQPRNAITSFLVNGVLAYAIYTSIRSGNYGLGVVVGAFSISFYGGNIVGSGASARRQNERIKRDAIAELRKRNPFYY